MQLSCDKCKGTVVPGLRKDRSESSEALTARFARLSSRRILKALRTMDALVFKDTGTIRDRINLAQYGAM